MPHTYDNENSNPLALYRVKLKRGYAARSYGRSIFKSVSKEKAELFKMRELREFSRRYNWRTASQKIYAYERINPTFKIKKSKEERLAAYKAKIVNRISEAKEMLTNIKAIYKDEREYKLGRLKDLRQEYFRDTAKQQKLIEQYERVLA